MQFYKYIFCKSNNPPSEMSIAELKAMIAEVSVIEIQNDNYVKKYKKCLHISELCKDIKRNLQEWLDKKTPKTYEEMVLGHDKNEMDQLNEELRFMSKLYARFVSQGNTYMADKTKESMNLIIKRLGR